MKPRPWLERWERQELKGVQDLGLPERFYKRAAEVAMPWEKYDLMKEYRWDPCSNLLQCCLHMSACYHHPFCHFYVKHRQCTATGLKNAEVLQQQSRAATGGDGHALAFTCLPSQRLPPILDQSMWDLWYRDRLYIFSCQCRATNCHTSSLLFHQWLWQICFCEIWGSQVVLLRNQMWDAMLFHWVNGLHVAWECSAFVFKGRF